jgi:hypothetical protein
MKKKILALLLALAMVFSLAACGGNGDESGTSGETSSTPAESSSDVSSETSVPTYTTAADALAAAQACYDELVAANMDYDTFLSKQAELNYDGNTDEFYVTPSSSLVDGFSDAVLALDEYEIGLSGETSYGYFVVMRLPISEDDLADIKDEYINDQFSAELNQRATDADVVEADVLSELDFDAYFEKLAALQETINNTYTDLTADYEDELTDEQNDEVEAQLVASLPEEVNTDCLSYLTDGKITSDTTVLTVDGLEVPASVYFYFMNYYETSYSNMATYYGQSFELSDDSGDGTTYLEAFRKLGRNYAVQYATAYNLAKEQGVEPTSESLEQMESVLSGSTQSSVLYVGTSLSAMRTVLTYSAYGDAYENSLYDEGGAKAPSDEDINNYIDENGYYNCRYILFYNDGTGETSED